MHFAKHKSSPNKIRQAQALRQSGSVVERIFRRALREQASFLGVKFRYQHPVDPYIVDFVCLSARLIVEIDGMSHDASVERDARRESFLLAQGFHILRFANADVMAHATDLAATACEEARRLQFLRWTQTPPRAD